MKVLLIVTILSSILSAQTVREGLKYECLDDNETCRWIYTITYIV